MNTQEQKNTSSGIQEKEIALDEAGQQDAPQQGMTQKDIDVCKQALVEWEEKYARLSADFENYKRRMIKEQGAWMQSARVSLFTNLLTIIDNFDRAMEYKKETAPLDMQSWMSGIAMIYTSLQDFLKKEGMQEVPYDTFNPLYHEALLQVDSKEHQADAIVEVFEKGYMLEKQIVRPAKVSVAK